MTEEPQSESARARVWNALNRLGDLSPVDPRRWVPEPPAVVKNVVQSVGIGPKDTAAELRRMADQLIAESQIPQYKPGDHHPAYYDMLKQLNPDEARIVRFLHRAGVQPAIDVRTKTLFQVGSQRIAYGINLIPEMASCRWPKQGHEYLGNLNRLGLVRFSAEPVEDIRRYSLLEVQPAAMEAIASVKSAITVYRSIHLSHFGSRFAETCFDMTGYDAGGWYGDGRHDKIIGSGRPKPKAHKH